MTIEHQPHPGPSVPAWWRPVMEREQAQNEALGALSRPTSAPHPTIPADNPEGRSTKAKRT